MPPWCHTVSEMVPLESCDRAAALLHQYFGAEAMQSFIGGSRWWQMRTQHGVPAEWISRLSDYIDVRAQHGHTDRNIYPTHLMHKWKRQPHRVNPRHEQPGEPGHAQTPAAGRFALTQEETSRLTRVMLYLHGGAYYFGSINTHKYAILKAATKYGGMAYAVNYRKAPQFPFPCGLQDCLAAYLYLIDPPPDAPHAAIDPARLVIAGDSAGGGLTLALLQLIRDLDLPRPAGAVLLSPWSDMSHSFPSILQNTATDYIPPYSFIHKPSTLWPLPKDTGRFSKRSRRSFRRSRSQQTLGLDEPAHARPVMLVEPGGLSSPIEAQIQLYCTNAQIFHPLCSPALAGSLGGLPPLFILVGDGEVLRDEILYLAHKAANPRAYPLNEALMAEFPINQVQAARWSDTPTQVHLQLYDEQCHVFPLFLYTHAARYAFRGMASFIKHVTGAPHATSSDIARAVGAAPSGKNRYSGKVPLERPQFDRGHMIRERVAMNGDIRPMEPPSYFQALRMAPASVGTIKPSTYRRFQKGHTIWDTRYASEAKRVRRRRERHEARAKKLLKQADKEGLLHGPDIQDDGAHWTDLGHYGPADLRNETPPPSALVGRRDTVRAPPPLTQYDAVTLLHLGLYQRASRRAQERGIVPPRGSLGSRAPRHTSVVGAHVHHASEKPMPFDKFQLWKRTSRASPQTFSCAPTTCAPPKTRWRHRLQGGRHVARVAPPHPLLDIEHLEELRHVAAVRGHQLDQRRAVQLVARAQPVIVPLQQHAARAHVAARRHHERRQLRGALQAHVRTQLPHARLVLRPRHLERRARRRRRRVRRRRAVHVVRRLRRRAHRRRRHPRLGRVRDDRAHRGRAALVRRARRHRTGRRRRVRRHDASGPRLGLGVVVPGALADAHRARRRVHGDLRRRRVHVGGARARRRRVRRRRARGGAHRSIARLQLVAPHRLQRQPVERRLPQRRRLALVQALPRARRMRSVPRAQRGPHVVRHRGGRGIGQREGRGIVVRLAQHIHQRIDQQVGVRHGERVASRPPRRRGRHGAARRRRRCRRRAMLHEQHVAARGRGRRRLGRRLGRRRRRRRSAVGRVARLAEHRLFQLPQILLVHFFLLRVAGQQRLDGPCVGRHARRIGPSVGWGRGVRHAKARGALARRTRPLVLRAVSRRGRCAVPCAVSHVLGRARRGAVHGAVVVRRVRRCRIP